MKEFNVKIEEVLSRTVSIEAKTKEEAIEKAQALYQEQEIVLDFSDFSDIPNFEVETEEE